MDVFSRPGADATGHEEVIFHHDRETGLRAVVAIHSTTLGPALGGTRFYPYESESDAVADVLRLSRGMTYKNAISGLSYGGGKAVIWGEPGVAKSEELLLAYGRFVESLGGRYYTACDVGTDVQDMDVIGSVTKYVGSRSRERGGSGDSSGLTAWSVFQGMRAVAEHLWSDPTLAGRTVGVAGLGKVGKILVHHLIRAGATVVATDIDTASRDWARVTHPQVELVADTDALLVSDIDIYAPCALGGALNDEAVPALRAKAVVGGANNQLAYPGVEKKLIERGILYAPDYVVNAGGVIQVADDISGFNFDRAKSRATAVYKTTREILRLADSEGVSPVAAADQLAEQRIASVGKSRLANS